MSSEYADEGTQAHELAEYKLKIHSQTPRNPVKDPPPFDADMDDYTTDYVNYIIEQVEIIRQSGFDPLVLSECRVDFSEYVKGGFGTADTLIFTENDLHVIDFKYGRHVVVSAYENSQLMLYALGAYTQFGFIYNFDTVKLSIYQPRADNFSSWEVSINDLLIWAERVLKPAAALAEAGLGDFCVGDWCQFCRAKNECRTNAEYRTAVAKYAFREPPLLDDLEIAEILGKADDLISWVNSVKAFALQAALSGRQWPGFKICEGRSNRKFTDEASVAEAAIAAGYSNIHRTTLITLTEMEKLLGKKSFSNILGAFVTKPPGKPVLVPESDKRPVMESISAADAFGDGFTEFDE